MKRPCLLVLIALISCAQPASQESQSDESNAPQSTTGQASSEEDSSASPEPSQDSGYDANEQEGPDDAPRVEHDTPDAGAKTMSFTEPVLEYYYSTNIDGKNAYISLRDTDSKLTGFIFFTGSSDFIQLKGERGPNNKFIKLDEYALVNSTLTRSGSLDLTTKEYNLTGTRIPADGSEGTAFFAKWTSPYRFGIRYSFVYSEGADANSYLFSVNIDNQREVRQELLEGAVVEHSARRMLSLDLDFDTNEDLYLLCNANEGTCGAWLWWWESDGSSGQYVRISAPADFANPVIDFANKRILCIGETEDGKSSYVDYYQLEGKKLNKTSRMLFPGTAFRMPDSD